MFDAAELLGRFAGPEPATAEATSSTATVEPTATAGPTASEPDPEPVATTPAEPAKRLEFGDVADGWTPESWSRELGRKADRCESLHPATAEHYRRWAAAIEKDSVDGYQTDDILYQGIDTGA